MSEVSVSATLFKEDKNRKQWLIFFIGKSLAEQAALALHVAAKKLRPYFQAHLIVLLTNLPLRNTIHKLDLSGRIARWAVELSEFGVKYKPRLALKGQILADFLAELPQLDVVQDNNGRWILDVDGASGQTGVGVG